MPKDNVILYHDPGDEADFKTKIDDKYVDYTLDHLLNDIDILTEHITPKDYVTLGKDKHQTE